MKLVQSMFCSFKMDRCQPFKERLSFLNLLFFSFFLNLSCGVSTYLLYVWTDLNGLSVMDDRTERWRGDRGDVGENRTGETFVDEWENDGGGSDEWMVRCPKVVHVKWWGATEWLNPPLLFSSLLYEMCIYCCTLSKSIARIVWMQSFCTFCCLHHRPPTLALRIYTNYLNVVFLDQFFKKGNWLQSSDRRMIFFSHPQTYTAPFKVLYRAKK